MQEKENLIIPLSMLNDYYVHREVLINFVLLVNEIDEYNHYHVYMFRFQKDNEDSPKYIEIQRFLTNAGGKEAQYFQYLT